MQIMKCRLRNIRIHREEGNSGAAAVEMTLVAPFLIFLALGMSEFGRMIQHHHVISKSVRDAGRYLSRVETDCPTTSAAWIADVATAKNLAMHGDMTGTAPLLIDYWSNPATITVTAPCFDNSAGTFRGASQIPLIKVTADVPYQDVGFLSILGLPTITLRSYHEEMHIGE